MKLTKENKIMSDYGWQCIKNIVLIIVVGLLTYYVSGFCLLGLCFITTFRNEKTQ